MSVVDQLPTCKIIRWHLLKWLEKTDIGSITSQLIMRNSVSANDNENLVNVTPLFSVKLYD
jgi:hypothetical protein